jgi:uncharacterized protein with HEPN domain
LPPENRDPGYLWDMLDAARAIREFTSGVTFHQYENDRKLRLAVERGFEIVGEAARRVSEAFQQAHPDIPWRQVIGLRNILAHDYGEVRHERIWLVITAHLPALILQLESLG